MAPLTPQEEQDLDFQYFLGFLGVCSVAAVGALAWGRRVGFKRYINSEHLHTDMIKDMAQKKKRLRGVVVKVGDAGGLKRVRQTRFKNFEIAETLILFDEDGFRLFHLPAFRRAPKDITKVNPKATISVRLAAVDAPEGAAFGSREQPYYKEAKKYLESNLLGKKVDVWPLRKDQYGRIVGMATVRDWGFRTKNISLEMVTRGLGVVYKASGAAYGGIQKDLFAAEEAAKSAKRGIWSQGDKLVLPGEHKAKTRAARESGEAEDPVEEEPKGIVSRLWGAIFGGRR